MVAVANDRSGGAYRQSQLGLGDIQMAGKTGTAQVRSYDNVASRSSSSVGWALKDHNLFVAFAPVDAPRYGIAVIVEHGGLAGSTAAAPRAREIMRTVLLKDPEMRARIERPLPPAAEGAALGEDEAFGAAPEPDAPVAAAQRASRAARATTTGPRPYLAEPR
jgi:penicillin-binding protein 2